MGKFISTIFSWLLVSLYFIFPIGWIYWLWIAIKFGGFAMFALALFPLTAPFAAIFGGWSLLFGVPEWIVDMFIK